MAGELATREPQQAGGGALTTGRAKAMLEALQEEHEQRQVLKQYVQTQMVLGTDFGVIPGTESKSLLKPGAEKLTQLFRCVPRYTIEEKIENWDSGLFFYRFRCQVVLQADGTTVAEGVGSCSTYESRYRWRNADRACPECGKPAIKRSKFPPRDQPSAQPGWYCFGKAGGCGANFAADDRAIVGQVTGRVQNPDLHDQANTVLKMAKKRALVDAAIALARCSDIFTQDVEDDAGPAWVDPPAAAAPPAESALDTAQYTALATGLTAARTADALASAWKAVVDTKGKSKRQLTDLTTIKDRCKAALAATPEAAPDRPAPAPPSELATKVSKQLADLIELHGDGEVDGHMSKLGFVAQEYRERSGAGAVSQGLLEALGRDTLVALTRGLDAWLARPLPDPVEAGVSEPYGGPY